MDILSQKHVPVFLIALAVALAARQVGAGKGIIPLKYAFTPLVTALNAGVALFAMLQYGMNGYRALILSALVMSLVADTLLMIVEINLMRYGIFYFMLAHALYIAAFSLEYDFRTWNIFLCVALLLFLAFFYSRIRGKTSGLDSAVMVYSAVISLMIFFAAARFFHEIGRPTVLSFVGSVAFFLSDIAIAIFTFIRPLKQESVIVWSLYAPAQLLMALSCYG